MTKPVMSYEAVVAAARQVHLHGGVNPLAGRADIQALATSHAKGCEYETTIGRPAHVDRLVCAIGAFFLVNNLMHVVIKTTEDDRPFRSARLGRWAGDIRQMIESTNLSDFVEIPAADVDRICAFQSTHDFCVRNDTDVPGLLLIFREDLGLEPA